MWRKPGAKNALTPVDRLQNPIANRFRCAIQFCNAETEETGSQPICCSNPGLCIAICTLSGSPTAQPLVRSTRNAATSE